MGLGDEKHQFNKRLRALARKDRAMERGFTTQLRPDGLLIVKPKRRAFAISGRSLVLFAAAFVGFKALAMAELGQATYESHVAELKSGTVIEQVGALVMQPDPASVFVGNHLRPYLR
ncbi:hypothetical protein [Aestuariivita sp.]|jgi:hypothetical protein|uniref:hypothetical protein n=1 Tax=Aestuariivita sp. TaxID=1872407 RepID=UPI0021709AAE|nr:hypothetical protein [Aestuariivita sp.]MCE8005912.1 hypothetical protein [Aestuariivita sp.]